MIDEKVLFSVTLYEAIVLKGPFAGTVTEVLAYDGIASPHRRCYFHRDEPILRKDFVLDEKRPGKLLYHVIEESCDGIRSLRTQYYF